MSKEIYINELFISEYAKEMHENYKQHPERYAINKIKEQYGDWIAYAQHLCYGILEGTANISTSAKTAAKNLGFGYSKKGVKDAINHK